MPTSPVTLENRLLAFAVAAGEAARSMPTDPTGKTVAQQLARSAMAPAAIYAEAREAHSNKDYAYKMRLAVKELRETMVWLRVAQGHAFTNANYNALIKECNELTAIAVTCVKKAKARP